MVQATSTDSHAEDLHASSAEPLLLKDRQGTAISAGACNLEAPAMPARSTSTAGQGQRQMSSCDTDLPPERQAWSDNSLQCTSTIAQSPVGVNGEAEKTSGGQVGHNRLQRCGAGHSGMQSAELAPAESHQPGGTSKKGGRLASLQAQVQDALALAQRLSDKAKRLSAACAAKPGMGLPGAASGLMPNSQQKPGTVEHEGITIDGHTTHTVLPVTSQASAISTVPAPLQPSASNDAVHLAQGKSAGTANGLPPSSSLRLPASHLARNSMDGNGSCTSESAPSKEKEANGTRSYQRSWSQWTTHDTAHQAALAAQHEELLSRREQLYKLKVARLEAQLVDQEARCTEQTARADTLQAQLTHTEELLAMARLGGFWEEAAAD